MKLNYINRPDDIRAYAQLIYDMSPTAKRHRLKSVNFALVLVVIVGTAIWVFDEPRTVFFWLIISIVWLIYIPVSHRRRYIKNMLKEYEKEGYKNFYGEHELTFDEYGITDQVKAGVNKTPWEKIEHVEQTDTHAFIFVESTLAYAIPKGTVDVKQFIDVVRYIQERSTK